MKRVNGNSIDATQPAREVPKEKWHQLMERRKWFIPLEITRSCRYIAMFLREAEEMHKVCGYETAEEMVRKGLQLDPQEIEIAMAWMELHGVVPVNSKE